MRTSIDLKYQESLQFISSAMFLAELLSVWTPGLIQWRSHVCLFLLMGVPEPKRSSVRRPVILYNILYFNLDHYILAFLNIHCMYNWILYFIPFLEILTDSLSLPLLLSLSLYIYIYIYIYWAFWRRNITVSPRVMKNSSDDLSTPVSNSTKCKQTKLDTFVLIPELTLSPRLGLGKSLAGFVPGLSHLACLATQKNCVCGWQKM